MIISKGLIDGWGGFIHVFFRAGSFVLGSWVFVGVLSGGEVDFNTLFFFLLPFFPFCMVSTGGGRVVVKRFPFHILVLNVTWS
jgi:hypothetical protein